MDYSGERALSPKDAARALSLSVWTVYRQIASGELKAVRLSKQRIGIPASEVNRRAGGDPDSNLTASP